MKNSTRVKFKRLVLRPLTSLKFKVKRMTHPIHSTEEIIKKRDEFHELYIIAERAGNKAKADEYLYMRKALDWALKEDTDG